VVQANIDQKEKWKAEKLGEVFDAYVDLTSRPITAPLKGPPDIVIWPEGALPALIDEFIVDPQYGPRLAALVRPGQTLLMGANRFDRGPDGRVRYYNALVAFHREAAGRLRVAGVYDKHRLVPFGEYMPLGGIARAIGFRSLVHMEDDFTAGPRPRPLSAPGLPAVQPLICYEALFPGLADASQRPAWILNVSNDAWFGVASGPRQHLNIASYRAIEQGLPIVRATPTGISAVIDAQGRVMPRKRLNLGDYGVIDARLPPAAAVTPYSRWGDIPFLGLLVLSAGAWLAGRRRRARSVSE